MRVLLDTHSFLWFITGDDKLSNRAKDLITDLSNQVLVSVASLWEISIKASLGKLILSRPFEELIPEQLALNEIDGLPINLDHLAKLINLPFYHRDPFDRLIIAQELVEELPIISKDPVFKAYSIEVIW
jgi:PIN domain nuclease of toxin-antitoxin system